MPPSLLETASQLPAAIYEEANNKKFKYLRIGPYTDGGAQDYVFADFFSSARLLMASAGYQTLAKPTQSVHENITDLLRADAPHDDDDPARAAVVPFARYLTTAGIIVRTAGYKELVVELYNPRKHCVRCHMMYTGGDRGRCEISHVMEEEYAWRVRGVETTYHSKCCGAGFTITGEADGYYDDRLIDRELCVNAIHTDDVRKVEYNDINIERCEIVDGVCQLGDPDEEESDEEE